MIRDYIKYERTMAGPDEVVWRVEIDINMSKEWSEAAVCNYVMQAVNGGEWSTIAEIVSAYPLAKAVSDKDDDPRFKRVADSWVKHVSAQRGTVPAHTVVMIEKDPGNPGWGGQRYEPGWYFGDETGGLHGPFSTKEIAMENLKNYDPQTCGYKKGMF